MRIYFSFPREYLNFTTINENHEFLIIELILRPLNGGNLYSHLILSLLVEENRLKKAIVNPESQNGSLMESRLCNPLSSPALRFAYYKI